MPTLVDRFINWISPNNRSTPKPKPKFIKIRSSQPSIQVNAEGERIRSKPKASKPSKSVNNEQSSNITNNSNSWLDKVKLFMKDRLNDAATYYMEQNKRDSETSKILTKSLLNVPTTITDIALRQNPMVRQFVQEVGLPRLGIEHTLRNEDFPLLYNLNNVRLAGYALNRAGSNLQRSHRLGVDPIDYITYNKTFGYGDSYAQFSPEIFAKAVLNPMRHNEYTDGGMSLQSMPDPVDKNYTLIKLTDSSLFDPYKGKQSKYSPGVIIRNGIAYATKLNGNQSNPTKQEFIYKVKNEEFRKQRRDPRYTPKFIPLSPIERDSINQTYWEGVPIYRHY